MSDDLIFGFNLKQYYKSKHQGESKMKKFFAEFKAFISRGNVLDMAIGVIVANAFGKITTALINNVFMPAIGLILGGNDFTDTLNWVVVAPTVDELGTVVDPGVTIGFGTFISEVINFIVIAFICFSIIKAFNKANALAEAVKSKKTDEDEIVEEVVAEEPPKPTQEELLAEIRDLLKAKSE